MHQKSLTNKRKTLNIKYVQELLGKRIKSSKYVMLNYCYQNVNRYNI